MMDQSKKYINSTLSRVIGMSLILLFFWLQIPTVQAATNQLSGNDSVTNESGLSVAITDLQITSTESDPTVPVKLLVSHGTLSMSTTTGLTFYDADGTTLTNPQTGATLYFAGDLPDINAALQSLTYTRTDGEVGTDTLEVSLVNPGEVLFADNGHLYEYITVTGGTDWTTAEGAAAARSKYGAQGYLTTITSDDENNFVSDRLENAGWMGASDQDSEGVWQWVTGPEDGTQFWSGGASGTTSADSYANWNSGEPNNSGDNENCAQFLAGGTGKWNDLPCSGGGSGTIAGYVVEYGVSGDLPEVSGFNISIDTVDSVTMGALTTLAGYAGGAGSVPTVTDYTNAGITSVTADNLADVNEALAAADPDTVDTADGVQAVVNAVAAAYEAALDTIADYVTSGGTPLSVSDYEAARVTGVTDKNVAAVNAALAASDPALVDTTDEIQDVVTQVIADLNRSISVGSGISAGSERKTKGGEDKNEGSLPKSESDNDQAKSSTPSAISQPHTDQQVYLNELLARVQNLQDQLDSREQGVLDPVAILSRDLTVGDEGSDVTSLQEFLIKENTGSAAAELARIGTTGYFSMYTKNALGEYQAAHNIQPHVGYFGSITRAQMKSAGLTGLWW
jgi:hypothetical protein